MKEARKELKLIGRLIRGLWTAYPFLGKAPGKANRWAKRTTDGKTSYSLKALYTKECGKAYDKVGLTNSTTDNTTDSTTDNEYANNRMVKQIKSECKATL